MSHLYGSSGQKSRPVLDSVHIWVVGSAYICWEVFLMYYADVRIDLIIQMCVLAYA